MEEEELIKVVQDFLPSKENCHRSEECVFV